MRIFSKYIVSVVSLVVALSGCSGTTTDPLLSQSGDSQGSNTQTTDNSQTAKSLPALNYQYPGDSAANIPVSINAVYIGFSDNVTQDVVDQYSFSIVRQDQTGDVTVSPVLTSPIVLQLDLQQALQLGAVYQVTITKTSDATVFAQWTFSTELAPVADSQAPTTPQNLATSTAPTASQVSMSWSSSTDNVGVSGYRVYRDAQLLATVSNTSFTDTTVSASTQYTYTVRAFDAANNESANASLVVNTPAAADSSAPSVPSGLTVTSNTVNSVAISWSASTDNVAVTGYKVYRDSVLIGTVSVTNFTDSTVSASKQYTYAVRAFDAANNESANATITVTTPAASDTTAPSVPSGLALISNTANSVSFSWSASSDNVAVTGYHVYRNTVMIANVATTSYTDTTVQENSTYQYRVAAFDASNNTSAQSSALNVTTPSATTTNFPDVLVPIAYDCADATILCVDDTSGPTQEYSTIQAAVDVAGAGDTVIVHDGTYAGFTVSTSGSSDTNRLTVTGNGNNVLINSGGSSEGRVVVYDADYVTIEGLTIQDASGYCLAARGATPDYPMTGVTFAFNTVSNCGSTNIYMSETSYSLMLGNVTYGSQTSHGIYLANGGSDHTVIRANRSYNNAKNGLHFNGDASIGGDGLHQYITIDSNIFYDNAQSGVDADGVYDSVFENNLIYGNARHGIRGFQIDSSAGVGRLTFINNTLVNNGSWGIKLSEDIGGHVFFNNIVMNNGGGCIASGNSSLTSDHNLYSTGCSFSQDAEATTISYSSWSSIYSDTSAEVASMSTVFTNAGSNDYTLVSGSPAIDTGVASFSGKNAPTEDIEGAARPNGSGIDIGAFEY